jgi:hypothetical protein
MTLGPGGYVFDRKKIVAGAEKGQCRFSIWMIQLLDQEAKRLGVPRQSLIKVWVAERLEKVG